MANIRLRTLDDLVQYEAQLIVRCNACGREGRYHAPHVLEYFRSKGWSNVLEGAGHRFRCDNGPMGNGCGAKGATLRGMFPKLLTVAKPLPLDGDCPAGVDPPSWARADERGRKLLVRRARG